MIPTPSKISEATNINYDGHITQASSHCSGHVNHWHYTNELMTLLELANSKFRTIIGLTLIWFIRFISPPLAADQENEHHNYDDQDDDNHQSSTHTTTNSSYRGTWDGSGINNVSLAS